MRREPATGEPAVFERPDAADMRLAKWDGKVPSKDAIYRSKGTRTMRIERRFTKPGQSAYAEIEFRKAISEIKNPDGSVVFRLADIEVPAAVQPGRGRHPGAEVFPQGRRSRAPEEGRGKRRSVLAVALRGRRGRACEAAEGRAATAPRSTPARSSIAWPAPGPIGAGRAAISPPRKTPSPSATSLPTCSPPSASRRTRRSGSTPACTGPMASTAPARAISMSTPSPAS